MDPVIFSIVFLAFLIVLAFVISNVKDGIKARRIKEEKDKLWAKNEVFTDRVDLNVAVENVRDRSLKELANTKKLQVELDGINGYINGYLEENSLIKRNKTNLLFVGNLTYETEFVIIEKDIDSNFFFAIKQFWHNEGKVGFSAFYQPESISSVNMGSGNFTASQLKKEFASWLSRIEKYNQLKLDFTDASEFAEFEYLDDGTNFLQENEIAYLQLVISTIDQKLRDRKNESNKQIVETLQDELEKVKSELKSEPKGKIRVQFQAIYEKLKVYAPVVLKEVLLEITKEVAKKYLLG